MTSAMKVLTDCRSGKDLMTKVAHAMLGECPNNLASFIIYVFLTRLA